MGWLQRLKEWLIGTPPAEDAPMAPNDPSLPSTAPSRSRVETRTQSTPRTSETTDATQSGAPRHPSPRPDTTLHLDAADFLPLPRDEIAAQAKQAGSALWANPWFGRRDQIPPADDPRTSLIDRGMVAEGLVTPQDLVKIHETGAVMAKRRQSLELVQHRAAMAGEAAVEVDRERRAALKAQKKQEAAERKRLHTEGVAQRWATDIIFAGRGVSARLHLRVSDAEKLQQRGLPVLHTPADLAAALGLTIKRLRWLTFHTEVASRIHYIRFMVPKKSGGVRILSAPHKALKIAQRWVFVNILKNLPVTAAAHGFVPGRSILSNALPHVGRAVLINFDLADFFPSVHFARVRSVFERLGYSGAVATLLALLCTECPRREVRWQGIKLFVATGPRGLPQGACTSPALANQVARRLDHRLGGLARKLGLAYTRYADDLTFSSAEPFDERIGYLMARVRHLAQDEGFAVNAKKSRVLRRHAAQMVTGLVVNDKPSLPRAEIRRLRAILHRAGKEGLASQNRAGHPHFVAQLRGKIALVHMVRPDMAAKLDAQLTAALSI